MISRLVILISLLSVFGLNGISQNTDYDNRLRELIRQDGQAEVSIPYTNRASVDQLTRNVSILSVKDNLISIILSPLTCEWFISQKFNYKISERIDPKGLVSALTIDQAMEWNSYPTYTQYDSIMISFRTNYPDLCQLVTIGTSINGKKILALKISDNVSVSDEEPAVFYTATIHGDETGGFILMLRLADYLLKNYKSNSRVKNLVDNLEIWINPMSNPDGTYRTGNIIASPTRFNANGIDLNRNFPDPQTPGTVLQKETIDMIRFMREHKSIISANFHAGVEVVNFPWDRWETRYHADHNWFNQISRAYADTVHIYSGPFYMNDFENGVTRGSDWYVIYGGRQDFVTWELQGREVTIELDATKLTPVSKLEQLWQNNWRSLLGYAENGLFGIHGVVLDSISNSPVPARIFIKGHDKDSSHVYSDNITGRFVRLLAPGTWNITFSARGYNDLTLNNITVASYQKVDLTVYMVPAGRTDNGLYPESPVLYPNPARNLIEAALPETISGHVNIRIINTSGKLISDYDEDVSPGIPLLIDLTGFSPGVYSIIFQNKFDGTTCRARFIVIK